MVAINFLLDSITSIQSQAQHSIKRVLMNSRMIELLSDKLQLIVHDDDDKI